MVNALLIHFASNTLTKQLLGWKGKLTPAHSLDDRTDLISEQETSFFLSLSSVSLLENTSHRRPADGCFRELQRAEL